MSNEQGRLAEIWRIRNAAAATLTLTEEQMRRTICDASVAELVGLVEGFSPARSAGPEWTRTFEPLVERLWTWRDDATIAELAAVFGARGIPWAAVAHAFSPEQGKIIRADLRHPAWARLPAFG